jgi:N-acetyltransferase
VTLRGERVVLEPLTPEDHDGLVAAASDGELRTLGYTRVPNPSEMHETITRCLAQQKAGTMLPFAVRQCGDGRVIGMTTICHADAENRRVEIGYTWYARSTHRTGTNTESKFLLLTHAFETLSCIAAEFRTHWLNHQSRRAIERLGAKQDGVLRSHKIMPDGTLHDTVVYSIIECEWPAVRSELRHRLAQLPRQLVVPG